MGEGRGGTVVQCDFHVPQDEGIVGMLGKQSLQELLNVGDVVEETQKKKKKKLTSQGVAQEVLCNFLFFGKD